MTELITIRKDHAVTSSLKVAEMFHKSHAHVLRDIENLDCSAEFNQSNFGFVKYKDAKGEMRPMYYMTKDGFTFLVMGYRGKKAAEFKEAYIKAFNEMEKILAEKQTEAWIETRRQGKLTRKSETDAIKELVEYAKAQGSTHADMLYMTYTKLANSIVGIKDRNSATVTQLNSLSFVENIILHTIRNGMALNLSYKEIYQANKKQLEMFSNISFLPQMLSLERS